MEHKWEIGDAGYLKTPYLGYTYFEIIDFEGATNKFVIQFTSGMEITVYEDELGSPV